MSVAASDLANGQQLRVAVNVNCPRGPIHFTLNLDLNRFSHQVIYKHFTSGYLYEPELSAFLVRALRPGDTFVDIGGHVGYFSLLAAALAGPTGAVFSFEPEPGNFADLVQNARENAFAQIHAFNLPVAAEAKDVTFYFNSDNDGGHALWDPALHPFNERTRTRPQPVCLQAASVDSFPVLQSRPVRVLKIDTEGAEHQVLLGARRWLAEHRVPFLVCEVNNFGLRQMHSSQLALRSFMERAGYATFVLDPEGYRPRAVRSDQVISAKAAEQDDVFNVLFSTAEAVESLFPG
jgi:FkbM family methyltransferase